MLGLALSVATRTWGSVSSLLVRRKKVRWVYEEPHWVVLVFVCLILLLRAGVSKLPLMLVTAWRERCPQDEQRQPPLAAQPPAHTGGGARFTGGAMPATAPTVRDAAVPVPAGPAVHEAVLGSTAATGGLSRKATQMVALLTAAEAPMLVCAALGIACHMVVFLLEVLQGSGHAPALVAESIWRIWIVQLINYTLAACWLAIRLLNTRLKLSRVRPSLQGDLSNLVDSAPDTSRRYAQEAALTQILKVGIAVTSGLMCLQYVGVNVSRILYLTSLSGFAFSFLLGDILANLFGGFVLYLTQPFAQGDWVQTPDGKVDGWIQTVGWYYTGIMRWDKRPHYIPNSTFSTTPIVNCSRMTHRRILFEADIRMRDLSKVEDMLVDIRSLVENHNDLDKTMHQHARLKDIQGYSAVLWVSCYTREIRLAKFLEVQESVILSISAILRKHKSNWASECERFVAMPGAKGEERLTAEFRRLLNARSTLLTHEKLLEERESELQGQRDAFEARKLTIKGAKQELEQLAMSHRQLEDLEKTRMATLEKRKLALEAKQRALAVRTEALNSLEASARAFEASPSKAEAALQKALAQRESSVTIAYQAVGIERAAIESERDALEQEKELLEERRRITSKVQQGAGGGSASAAAGAPVLDAVAAVHGAAAQATPRPLGTAAAAASPPGGADDAHARGAPPSAPTVKEGTAAARPLGVPVPLPVAAAPAHLAPLPAAAAAAPPPGPGVDAAALAAAAVVQRAVKAPVPGSGGKGSGVAGGAPKEAPNTGTAEQFEEEPYELKATAMGGE